MSDSRYIFRGSIINMAGMALRTALSPLALLLPRFFPPELFGVFVSLRSLITVCRQLFGFEFKRGLAWWIPRRQAEGELRNTAVWSALAFAGICSTIGSLLLFIAFVFFGGFIPEALRRVSPVFLLVCLASIPGMVALDCACGCMDGIRRPKYSALYGNSLSIGLLPIFAILMQFLRVPYPLALSIFVANWLCALIVLWRMKEFFPTGCEKAGLFPERRLLEYSVPLAFSNWALSGLNNMDLWLVAWLIGPSEAGIYGVMLMLSDGVRKVRQSYDPLIVPVVSRMEARTIREKLPEVLTYSAHMVSSLQLIVALFLACFYREILSISGSQFTKFGTAFIMLVSSNLAGGFSGISYQALLGLGKSSMLFKLNLAMLGLASAAGVILVPSYGLTGAACLALLVAILQAVVLFYLQTRIHGKWPYKRDFLVNATWIGGFIVASSLTASWFAETSLLLRTSVFFLFITCLGAWAFVVRKTFIPKDATKPMAEDQQ
jgi:O-antigen/teichoic acid export membrane protein